MEERDVFSRKKTWIHLGKRVWIENACGQCWSKAVAQKTSSSWSIPHFIFESSPSPLHPIAFHFRFLHFHPLLSEASCRSAIVAAQNFVADVGVSSASRSGGLAELARSKEKNSERDCQRLMVKKYGLALPVQRSVLQTEDTRVKIPILKMEDWADFMLRNNCWHVLCGLVRPDPERERAILASFWSKFRKLSPGHDVFKLESAGRLQLHNTAPVVLHGDEGRGRKHTAYLVVSFRGLLGRGIHTGEREKHQKAVKKPYLKQLCNYRGHSFTSRFMIAGLRKCDYTGDNSNVFSALMSSCAEQAKSVATTGIRDPEGNKRWMIMLHITGDWPWLHKSGNFKRSFHNAQKKRDRWCFMEYAMSAERAKLTSRLSRFPQPARYGPTHFSKRTLLQRLPHFWLFHMTVESFHLCGLGTFSIHGIWGLRKDLLVPFWHYCQQLRLHQT